MQLVQAPLLLFLVPSHFKEGERNLAAITSSWVPARTTCSTLETNMLWALYQGYDGFMLMECAVCTKAIHNHAT